MRTKTCVSGRFKIGRGSACIKRSTEDEKELKGSDGAGSAEEGGAKGAQRSNKQSVEGLLYIAGNTDINDESSSSMRLLSVTCS